MTDRKPDDVPTGPPPLLPDTPAPGPMTPAAPAPATATASGSGPGAESAMVTGGVGGSVSRSVFSWRDLGGEVALALTARPARTLLTALGTILGVAALVATIGLARTAGNQIVTRVSELEATEVVVTPERRNTFGGGGNRTTGSAIPWDAESRLTRLNGVVAAGTRTSVNVGERLARSVPVIDPLGRTEFQIPVIAVSPGLFEAVRAELLTGRTFDEGHSERGDPVAVLGPAAAQRLNVVRVDNTPSIFVGEEPLAVIGILADTARQPDLLSAIIIPDSVARARFGAEGVEEVQIEVEPGAAQLIKEQAPTALAPNTPELLQAAAPPEPERLQRGVESDLNSLFLVLGGISLIVGAIGIANVTLVSVLERTGEIGLRRALGARRSHIAAQFLTESVALGAFAGILGASAGVLSVVAVSASRQWSPVLDPWLPLVAPILGAVIGLVAGTYPAWKAASTEPIAALRGSA
ncbi:MAG: ABC transporter permease [Actinomycetota bacterium]